RGSLRLARVGERQELELHAAGIASFLQELFGSGGVVAVLLLEPLLPLRVPALGDRQPSTHIGELALASKNRADDLLTVYRHVQRLPDLFVGPRHIGLELGVPR